MRIVFSRHAKLKISQRNISEKLVLTTVKNPDFELPGYSFRVGLLKKFGKKHLKVVVVKEKRTIVVVTCHWIEKIKRR